ncbi:hypothetical protein [Caenimonas sp. SL110]|uniref:hypothetical protein n=1 Tax=Caenimonas sp. SL110 TaxID=1450524 RepID=UPI0006535AC1|nr:hypothetical protein [Caenimonas sp. SL110]
MSLHRALARLAKPAAAVGAAVATIIYLAAQPDTPAQATRTQAPVPAEVSLVAAPAASAQTTAASLAPVARAASGPSSKLVAELRSARDWRAFALNARTRPEEGGYFYAMYVSNICGMPIASMPEEAQAANAQAVAKHGTISTVRMELAAKLSGRCSSFSADEASSLYDETRRASENGRDPLMAATRKLRGALNASSDEKQEALKSLLALDDPLALFDGNLLMLVMARSAETKGELWFNGTSYGSDPVKYSTLQVAMAVAGCSSQAPCEVDTHMMLACLGGQFCTDSREDYLRNQFTAQGGMTEAQYAEGLNLAAQMTRAISNKQVSAFVR